MSQQKRRILHWIFEGSAIENPEWQKFVECIVSLTRGASEMRNEKTTSREKAFSSRRAKLTSAI
jgi:hypothetical protein